MFTLAISYGTMELIATLRLRDFGTFSCVVNKVVSC